LATAVALGVRERATRDQPALFSSYNLVPNTTFLTTERRVYS